MSIKNELVRVSVSLLVALILAGCESAVVTDRVDSNASESNQSPDELATPDLFRGEANFDANCTTCHGANGDSIFNPIAINSCLTADCSSIETLSEYIDQNMPQGNATACTLNGEDSCALTVAAYIFNGFTTDSPDPIIKATDGIQSPLARLTNNEYVNSIRTLLDLDQDSANMDAAVGTLATDSVVKGLTSDSSTQLLTQISMSGYALMADAAGDDFLDQVVLENDLKSKLGCGNQSSIQACAENFGTDLISKAYRRPSTADDEATVTSIYETFEEHNETHGRPLSDFELQLSTVKAILKFVFLSPEFLLIVESGEITAANSNAASTTLTDYEIATRMALFLAGTLPDDALLNDAKNGRLSNASVRAEHADRLMNSDVGINQFNTLILNWLGIDPSLADEASIADMTAFIEDWFTTEAPFSDLYQAPVSVENINGSRTEMPVGVLGLQAFVASHTSFPTPSFITRGVFFVERLLCEALPDDIPADALDAGELTPVEVFFQHANQDCATCHKVVDNYGAAFQQFDAETSLFSGAQDFGTSFDLYDIGDVTTSVSTLSDLGQVAGSSNRASGCMADLWYRHSLRRDIDSSGKDDDPLIQLQLAWLDSGAKSMKDLLRAIVTSDRFITLYY